MTLLKKLTDSQNEVIKSMLNHGGIVRLFKVGFIIFIMAHFMACMWNFVAKF